MRIKSFFFIIFLLGLIPISLTAQTRDKYPGVFIFEGVVYGYENDASRKLFKKNKQTVLEGTLEGVKVNVFVEDKLFTKTISNSKGEFKFILKFNERYRIEVFKEGYDGNILWIDTKQVPVNKTGGTFKFTGAEFILNSFNAKSEEISNEAVGTLYYNPEMGCMDFSLNENRGKKNGVLHKKDEQENLVELMKRAVVKNKKKEIPAAVAREEIKTPDKLEKEPVSGKISKKAFSDFHLVKNKGIKNIIKGDFSVRAEDLIKARKQLELDKLHAVSEEDFLLIQQREAIISAAESELQAAVLLINIQKSKIKLQSRALFLSIVSLVILLVLSVVIFKYYKEKSKMHRLLYRKNKKILDSINYAERIQKSILIKEKEIQKYLPESFIYYRPKDVVSGDFYWFSEIKGKLVFAIVDCTGHGVPGAFMSLIGNTLLNQIVNEKQIFDAASILNHLHAGIMQALQQEKEDSLSEDGMDMALCVIDQKNKTLEYAGAMNPLYIVSSDTLSVINADARSIGGKTLRQGQESSFCFSSQTVPLHQESTVYMFTDGYMDQFGGEKNKKFNTVNFKKLLLEIQKLDMPGQKAAIGSAMNDWKKNYQQIDDMLIAGFKI